MNCQQSDVYRAEERALRSLRLPEITIQEAEALVERWRDLPWFEQNFPRVVAAKVVARKTSKDGSCGGLVSEFDLGDRFETPVCAVVEMAPAHMNALYLAHELCHPLAEVRYSSRAHDPWFARTYLQLVYLALGSDVYQTLYAEFEREGVDHRIDE